MVILAFKTISLSWTSRNAHKRFWIIESFSKEKFKARYVKQLRKTIIHIFKAHYNMNNNSLFLVTMILRRSMDLIKFNWFYIYVNIFEIKNNIIWTVCCASLSAALCWYFIILFSYGYLSSDANKKVRTSFFKARLYIDQNDNMKICWFLWWNNCGIGSFCFWIYSLENWNSMSILWTVTALRHGIASNLNVNILFPKFRLKGIDFSLFMFSFDHENIPEFNYCNDSDLQCTKTSLIFQDFHCILNR